MGGDAGALRDLADNRSTTSGPAVAALVRSKGRLVTSRSDSPRARVVLAAVMTNSSRAASARRR
ncbi:hypothetical protein ACFY4B_11695 [Kitasatospora sp. NPDC001261]|uniref:hypothetical protein n=1 Tax=Kitasatospora sp. NPDC001261 TaxID=3364012 RepID=UPI00368C19EE